MRGVETEADFQVVLPVVELRAGHSEDQIERPPAKPGADDRNRLFDFGPAMVALQDPERLGPERLGSQAHAVNTGFGQDIGLLGIESPGIRLDRPLGTGRRDQPSPDDVHQPTELGGIETSRGPSSDEDRVNFPRTHQRHRHLAFEGRQVAIGHMIDAGQRGEVAVAALIGAKRDMDVSRAWPLPGRLDLSTRAFRDHGTASMKRTSGTAAFMVASTLMLKVTIAEEQP